MFCSKCNKEIADGSHFCEFCGATVEAKETLNSNETPSASADNQKKKKRRILPDTEYFYALISLSPRPTRWLNLYLKTLLPIFFLYSIEVAANAYGKTLTLMKDHPLVYIGLNCINISFLVLIYLACTQIWKMRPKGYIINLILLLTNIFFFAFYFNIIAAVAWLILFAIPNLIYFKKRKNLFYDEELHKAALDKIS